MNNSEATDYIGNYIYVNNTLKRILTENGYIENNVYYFYVKDHLGSIRVTANSSGVSQQSINYYPYGMQFGDASGSDVQPYKYSGKEYDSMHGLNLYDSKARLYDPALGRFTTMDPLAEKYYSMSPYIYGLNNPLRNLDLNGDSITILNLGSEGEHIALLIQDENNKWRYYSFNGVPIYNVTKGSTGGRGFDDVGEKVFDSPQQFMDSKYNQGAKNIKEKNNRNINAYGYPEGYVLSTTMEEDNIIRKTFEKVVGEGYDLLFNQCATVVQKALNSVLIDTSVEYIISTSSTGMILWYQANPYLPSTTFKAIIKNNPNGKYVIRK